MNLWSHKNVRRSELREREREIYIICPVNFSSVYYRALKLWKKENQSIYNNNFNDLLNVKRRNLHFKRCSMENETFEIYLFVLKY